MESIYKSLPGSIENVGKGSNRLLVAKKREFLACVHIATESVDAGQIFSACGSTHVVRHILLHSCHPHLFVVSQSHLPATVEAQYLLCPNRQCRKACRYNRWK